MEDLSYGRRVERAKNGNSSKLLEDNFSLLEVLTYGAAGCLWLSIPLGFVIAFLLILIDYIL